MLGDHDTIAAISTAKGVGALSIVRVSGPQTFNVLQKCFNKIENFQSHHAYHGFWLDPRTNNPVDDVLLLYFGKGRGFTGEEAAEVICHGGLQITELVLQAMLHAGARLARAGEFTYRAVMNDKLDLPRAEAILEIIKAQTPQAAALALKNIQGALSEKLGFFETEFIFLLANLEAAIDFTTEDIQPVNYLEMRERLENLLGQIKSLTETFLPARVTSRGLRVVLAGKPNAGKSSLLNALLGVSRSIVHEQPGTTRDTIEADLLLGGTLFRLIDTAGLRETRDSVESQGVLRTREELNAADVIIYVVDASAGMTNEETQEIKRLGLDRLILNFNKVDLKNISTKEEINHFGIQDIAVTGTNALSEAGVIPLRQALTKIGKAKSLSAEVDSSITTTRQFEALEKAIISTEEAKGLLSALASPDLISFSLREALVQIQALLGKNCGDDVMDRVFKEFCIGK